MSNASNLSTLANVLDDGTSGQFLKSTGSGGVAFDTVAAGAVVYATADLLPLSGNSAGDMAYVTATNRFYINNGSGWYSVSLVNTNPNITSVQDAGSNTTPFTLATDGTATVITVTAADPEEVPLTYDYSVTSGSLNGSTVTKGTGSNSNVFTVTPHASQDATFTITFTASDGINQATSANAFSLSFITIVTDSNHTTLLATATGISDNNNITDSSSNSHSITVNGDAHAGTFSPYRHGGYSTYFDASGLMAPTATGTTLQGDTTFTVEFWYNTKTVAAGNKVIWGSRNPTSNSNNDDTIGRMWQSSGHLLYSVNGSTVLNVSSVISANTWHYIALVVDSGAVSLYLDGDRIATGTYTSANGSDRIIVGHTINTPQQYIADFRINTSAEYSGISHTVPTEPLLTTSDTVFHLPTTGYLATDLILTGTPSKTPFSPYDYSEYDAADHGGSLYFNGTNSAVQIADNDDFDFGTGDLTIECWVYPEVTSNSYPGFLGTSSGWGSVAASGFRFDNLGDSKFQMSWYGPGDPFLETQSTYKHNQWYHFVVTRTGGSTWRMFVNGILEDTGTNSTAYDISIGGNNLQVGGKTWDGGNGWFKGNIADLRLTKGSVVSEYQTTSTTVGTKIFTPRTSPISSSGSELHLKGTDASIIDKSQGTNLKLAGGTTGSTTQVKFSNTKSMYFDGTGDYLQASLTEDNLPNEFTIEGWVYTSTVSGPKGIFGIGTTAFPSTDAGIAVFTRSSTYNYDYAFYCNGNQVNSTTPPTANSWQHFALVRDSNNLMSLYLDGSSIASNTISGTVNGSIITVGGYYSSSFLWNGYIQDFRITKGIARYTTSFTPPSAPLEG